MTKRPWTDEEVGHVLATLNDPLRRVALDLQRSSNAVRNMRHRLSAGWSRKNAPWVAYEDELIANVNLSAIRAAEVLPGRSAGAVDNRRSQLGIRVGPSIRNDPRAVGERMVLARTCTQCGLLLPGAWFPKRNTGGTSSWCKKCSSLHATAKPMTPQKHAGQRAWVDRMQAITSARATRSGYEYTEFDHAIMANPAITIASKALAMGRTFQAARGAVSRNGYKSARFLADPATKQWRIENPNADRVEEITAALKQECESAGVTFPVWDWDDEDLKESA